MVCGATGSGISENNVDMGYWKTGLLIAAKWLSDSDRTSGAEEEAMTDEGGCYHCASPRRSLRSPR